MDLISDEGFDVFENMLDSNSILKEMVLLFLCDCIAVYDHGVLSPFSIE